MRPWTLYDRHVTKRNPLLRRLSLVDNTAKAPNDVVGVEPQRLRSYAAAWENYINGNVASQMSERYIMNLVAATIDPADRCSWRFLG